MIVIKSQDYVKINPIQRDTHDTKQEIQRLLQNIINEKTNVIDGCAQLVAYLDAGYDFIYRDFDTYYGKLLKFPLPTEYHLWNPQALEIKLKELEEYQSCVIQLARKLLEELQEHKF